MNFKYLISIIGTLILGTVFLYAQDFPSISPKAHLRDAGGQEGDVFPASSFVGSAPVCGVFTANPANAEGWIANYEWRFYTDADEESPYLVRYEQDTQFTFTKAGNHRIVCYATFTRGSEKITFTKEYWDEAGAITVTISESKLEMPNAFSPNGDGINDIYRAKSGYQSITEFNAYIYNRWGQKLYEWHDPAGGWDGTYKGKEVPQGVYFCLVKAKGADGRDFNIRKDVNLLRGYTEEKQ